jgi:hypothetical protein
MPRRFAIVTYDPEKVKGLAPDTTEQRQLGDALVDALRGVAYAKDRGLLNVTLMDQVAPNARPWDYAKDRDPSKPLRNVGGAIE